MLIIKRNGGDIYYMKVHANKKSYYISIVIISFVLTAFLSVLNPSERKTYAEALQPQPVFTNDLVNVDYSYQVDSENKEIFWKVTLEKKDKTNPSQLMVKVVDKDNLSLNSFDSTSDWRKPDALTFKENEMNNTKETATYTIVTSMTSPQSQYKLGLMLSGEEQTTSEQGAFAVKPIDFGQKGGNIQLLAEAPVESSTTDSSIAETTTSGIKDSSTASSEQKQDANNTISRAKAVRSGSVESSTGFLSLDEPNVINLAEYETDSSPIFSLAALQTAPIEKATDAAAYKDYDSRNPINEESAYRLYYEWSVKEVFSNPDFKKDFSEMGKKHDDYYLVYQFHFDPMLKVRSGSEKMDIKGQDGKQIFGEKIIDTNTNIYEMILYPSAYESYQRHLKFDSTSDMNFKGEGTSGTRLEVNPDVCGEQPIPILDDGTVKKTIKVRVDCPEEQYTLNISKFVEGTEEPLSGAEFSLSMNKNNNRGDDLDLLKSGLVTGDSGRTSFPGLTDGKYCLKETAAPDGFNLVQPIYFTIIEGEPKITGENWSDKLPSKDCSIDSGNSSKEIDLKVYDSIKDFCLTVNKEDEHNNPLAGADFILKNSDQKTLQPEKANQGTSFVFDALEPGTYYLSETKTPSGYTPLEKAIEVVISKDGKIVLNHQNGENIGDDNLNSNITNHVKEIKNASVDKNQISLDVQNVRKPDKVYQLSIDKIDTAGSPLKGAEFELIPENGSITNDNPKNSSNFMFEPLKEGTYYLKETSAPVGYIKLEKVIQIVINEDDKNDECTKVDISYKNSQPSSTDDASEIRLNDSSKVEFENSVEEINAITASNVDDNLVLLKFSLQNTKKTSHPLPVTGAKNNHLLELSFSILLLAGVFSIIYLLRCRKGEE